MTNVFVVDFTGKTVENDVVFETTRKADAEKSGIADPHARYEPIPLVLGKGQFLPKLEEVLEKMKEGDEKTVELSAADGFGEYDQNKVGLVPLTEFTKRQVNPVPGLVVDINNQAGKVQSVSGGRVRVDFNHELAGKKISYNVKVIKVLTKPQEQSDALVNRYIPLRSGQIKTTVKDKEIVVDLPPIHANDLHQLKHFVADQLMEVITGIEHVKFVETYEKHEHHH